MSNFKDRELEISRILNAKKDTEDKGLTGATRISNVPYSSQTEKLSAKSEYLSSKNKVGATPSLFSQPRNLIGQEEKTSPFTRPHPVEKAQEQKTSIFSTTPVRNPFDKPISSQSPITPKFPTPLSPSTTLSPLNSVITNPNLSFKEKIAALQQKQAEMRASFSTPSTKPAPAIKTPVRSTFTPTTSFAEQKQTPLFAERKPTPLFAERKPTPPFAERRQVPALTDKKQVPLFTANRAQGESQNRIQSNSILPTQFKTDYKISSEEFIQLRDFLYAQSGIFIAENRKYLMENRLSTRLRELGLRNFNEYHSYLRFDHNRMKELNKLFENMTTNETSFFRNNPQLDIFKDKVLARVINEQREKGQKKIHIWSAGCSSGEEPYTIAIILHEYLKNELSSWNIKITANDLSPAMLETAKKGLYSEYALRTTPQEIINKYFTKEGKLFRIMPSVQKLVNFEQINLASSQQLAKVERSHIVFCRNVIIYFDDEMKRHVINAFYDNLLPNGCLLIGHSESLHNISRTFIPEHFTGAIVYGKKN